MDNSILIEAFKALAVCIATVNDGEKVKRKIAAVRASWSEIRPPRRQIIVDLVLILMSLGAPIHYGFQAAHEISRLI